MLLGKQVGSQVESSCITHVKEFGFMLFIWLKSFISYLSPFNAFHLLQIIFSILPIFCLAILYKLKLDQAVNTIPTVGFNVETILYENLRFNVWVCKKVLYLLPLNL